MNEHADQVSVTRYRRQHQINLIWECTQASIAVAITVARIYVSLHPDLDRASEALNNAFFLVIGFYFGRTNHNRPGDLTKGGHDRAIRD